MRCDDVALTSVRRHFDVIWPLGLIRIYFYHYIRHHPHSYTLLLSSFITLIRIPCSSALSSPSFVYPAPQLFHHPHSYTLLLSSFITLIRIPCSSALSSTSFVYPAPHLFRMRLKPRSRLRMTCVGGTFNPTSLPSSSTHSIECQVYMHCKYLPVDAEFVKASVIYSFILFLAMGRAA